MLHWYCKTTYNLGQFLFPKATYNLGRREYVVKTFDFKLLQIKALLNRERFDYAKVLVATASLDIVNTTDIILIDGELVDIKMCEEWGFNLGDDACLFDAEEESNCSNDDGHANFQRDSEVAHNVDILVDNIVNGLTKDEKTILLNQDKAVTVEHASSERDVAGGPSGRAPSTVNESVGQHKQSHVHRLIASFEGVEEGVCLNAKKRSIRQLSCHLEGTGLPLRWDLGVWSGSSHTRKARLG